MGDSSKTIQLGKEGLIKASGGSGGEGGDGITTSSIGSGVAKSRKGRERRVDPKSGSRVKIAATGYRTPKGKKKMSKTRRVSPSPPARRRSPTRPSESEFGEPPRKGRFSFCARVQRG